jgi:hypothetical protein
MEKEFELDEDGDIYIENGDNHFTREMKYLCGTILEIDCAEYKFFQEPSSGWFIHPEMVHFINNTVVKDVLLQIKAMAVIMPL